MAADLSLVAAEPWCVHVPPAVAAAAAGVSRTVQSAAARCALVCFFRGLAASVCLRVAEGSQACAASPVGRRDA
eukprot:3915237-Prymnesium_polylepis.1